MLDFSMISFKFDGNTRVIVMLLLYFLNKSVQWITLSTSSVRLPMAFFVETTVDHCYRLNKDYFVEPTIVLI